jgi:hypothetical protein
VIAEKLREANTGALVLAAWGAVVKRIRPALSKKENQAKRFRISMPWRIFLSLVA